MKKALLGKISLCIILVAIISQFASCGSSSEESSETETSAQTSSIDSTEEVELKPNLPEKDWGGREFRVLGRQCDAYPQFDNFEVFSAGENGDIVNDTVYRRNLSIEAQYNTIISQTLYNEPEKELQKTVLSGDDIYDLAFVELINIGAPAVNGYFYDMNNANYIDFEKPWWNPEVNESVSVDNKIFFTTSDFSLRDKARTYIMLYNKNMTDTYALGDVIQLVRDGKWTIDTMDKWSKTVAKDLDGDGKMTGVDRFGIGMDSYISFLTFINACDNRICTKDDNDKLVLSMNTDRMALSIDKVMQLTCNKDTGLFCNDFQGKVDYDFWNASFNIFTGGESLFVTTFPNSLKLYSAACDFDYGVIPYPMLDENQTKYYTKADSYAMLFGIPSSCTDTDFAGFMLEALSYSSSSTTLPAFYEISCKTKYTYDKDSSEMLDLIFSGIVYDPGVIYSIGGLTDILTGILPQSKQNTMASLYAEKEPGALLDIEEIHKKINEVK